jgi:hypothetical protein
MPTVKENTENSMRESNVSTVKCVFVQCRRKNELEEARCINETVIIFVKISNPK